MSLADMWDKINPLKVLRSYRLNGENSDIIEFNEDGQADRFPLFRKIFLSLTIILVGTLSFGIGRLSVIGKSEPIRIEYDRELITNDLKPANNTAKTATVLNAVKASGAVVVSKNGSKYHYSYCPGAKQIKEENKIIFNSSEAAEAAGYSLAANCKVK